MCTDLVGSRGRARPGGFGGGRGRWGPIGTSGSLAPNAETKCPSSFSTRGPDSLPQRTAYSHLYIEVSINVLVAEALQSSGSLTTGAFP